MTKTKSLQEQLDELKAENTKLKAQGTTGLSMKVSQKGALSIYGLGRFPVTLYKEQWNRLLTKAEDIKAFITTNDASLKEKERKAS